MTKSLLSCTALLVVGCAATDSPDIGSIGQEINPCPINNSLPVTPQGTVKPDICDCEPSPILIDVKGNGFALTDAAGGVRFDIRDIGEAEQIGWPEPGSDDAFLALDRNGDGVINSGAELFGNAAEQPASAKYANGYNALSVFDSNGDGIIDERDPIYTRLLLWQDFNHDGVSQPGELHGLAEMGIAALSVQYSVSKKADRYGNQFHYRANVYGTPGSSVGRYSYDVFPAVEGMDVGDDGAVDIERELSKTIKVAPLDGCGGGTSTGPTPCQIPSNKCIIVSIYGTMACLNGSWTSGVGVFAFGDYNSVFNVCLNDDPAGGAACGTTAGTTSEGTPYTAVACCPPTSPIPMPCSWSPPH